MKPKCEPFWKVRVRHHIRRLWHYVTRFEDLPKPDPVEVEKLDHRDEEEPTMGDK